MAPFMEQVEVIQIVRGQGNRPSVLFYGKSGEAHVTLDGKTPLTFENTEGVVGFLLAVLFFNGDARWAIQRGGSLRLALLDRHIAGLAGSEVSIDVLPLGGNPNDLQHLLERLINDPSKAAIHT